MKVNLGNDILHTHSYNRDNGAGAAEKVVTDIRNGVEAGIQQNRSSEFATGTKKFLEDARPSYVANGVMSLGIDSPLLEALLQRVRKFENNKGKPFKPE